MKTFKKHRNGQHKDLYIKILTMAFDGMLVESIARKIDVDKTLVTTMLKDTGHSIVAIREKARNMTPSAFLDSIDWGFLDEQAKKRSATAAKIWRTRHANQPAKPADDIAEIKRMVTDIYDALTAREPYQPARFQFFGGKSAS
jgi:hypothetical protein